MELKLQSAWGTPTRRQTFLWLSFVLLTLPFTLSLLWFNYAAVVLREQRNNRASNIERSPERSRQTVLITGSATAYGLDLARAFHSRGYRVIGADVKYGRLWPLARLSRSISKHYDIPMISAVCDADYVAHHIVKLARDERAVLWIECSEDIATQTIVTAQRTIATFCASYAIESNSYKHLRNGSAFRNFLADQSIPATECHQVGSRRDIHRILNGSLGKKQFTVRSSDGKLNRRALLPRRTVSQTYQDVAQLQITGQKKLLLEESLECRPVYKCFAIVSRGEVVLSRMHKIAGDSVRILQSTDVLFRALEACTAIIARELGDCISNHLTVEFALEEELSEHGVVQRLAVAKASFQPPGELSYARGDVGGTATADAYLSTLQQAKSLQNGHGQSVHGRSVTLDAAPRYALPVLVVRTILLPTLRLLTLRARLRDWFQGLSLLFNTLASGDEVFYDFSDPLPAFWQYTVIAAGDVLQGAESSV